MNTMKIQKVAKRTMNDWLDPTFRRFDQLCDHFQERRPRSRSTFSWYMGFNSYFSGSITVPRVLVRRSCSLVLENDHTVDRNVGSNQSFSVLFATWCIFLFRRSNTFSLSSISLLNRHLHRSRHLHSHHRRHSFHRHLRSCHRLRSCHHRHSRHHLCYTCKPAILSALVGK